MVAVAQQGDAVRAGHAGTGAFHGFFHHPAVNTLAVVGFGRGIGLGHQHVAVGQHVQPARVVEPFGESSHLRALGGDWLGALGPAGGRGDVHRGYQGLVRFRQFR
ncbi:hypothetical protein D3C86_1594270 [compost metagenome]